MIERALKVTVALIAGHLAQAILSCSITISSPDPSVTIRFRKGTILIHGPPYKPKAVTIQYFDKPGSSIVEREVKLGSQELAFEGGGWHFQADEVARCIRDGKKQSVIWGLDKSLVEMGIFDETRRQGGYVFVSCPAFKCLALEFAFEHLLLSLRV